MRYLLLQLAVLLCLTHMAAAELSPLERSRTANVEILVAGRLSGSGWIATPDGLAFTAAHVIRTPGPVTVKTSQGDEVAAALLAVDLGHDLALLRLERHHGFFPYLPLAGTAAGIGEPLHLTGSPLNRHDLTVPGELAADRPHFEWNDINNCYTRILPVAAMTPDGVSGGAWVNELGEVVGTQSGMMQRQGALMGIGFMAPAEAAAALLASRRDASTNWLGATLAESWETGTNPSAGLLITGVAAGSPAQASGLKRGDRVVSVDGEQVGYRDDLLNRIRRKPTGETVQLGIVRDNTPLETTLHLLAREKL